MGLQYIYIYIYVIGSMANFGHPATGTNFGYLNYICLKMGGQSFSGRPKLAILTVVLSVVKQKRRCG